MDILGERLTSITRRIKTPTSVEWRSGEYLDSGLAMIVSHNLAHKQRESLRQIVSSFGPGTITNSVRGYTYQGTPLSDVRDPGTYSDLNSISWDHQTSRTFGPFFAIADRDVTDEQPTWRKVRVCLDVTAGGLTVYACATQRRELPSYETHIGYASATSSAGRTTLTLDLSISNALAAQSMPCRRAPGDTPEHAIAAQYSLWVGWYGSSGTNSVWTISAYEVR